jgi:hypothetical protein
MQCKKKQIPSPQSTRQKKIEPEDNISLLMNLQGLLKNQTGGFPSQLSPNESPGNPHENSTGESRQGFPRDLRGSEGESPGICKGVKGSP